MVPEKRDEKRVDETFLEAINAELRHIGVASPERVIEEFELLSISETEEDTGLPRAIAKKVYDRIETFAHLLEEVIQPDTSLTTMNEYGFFTEEEMGQIMKGYRGLRAILRRHTMAHLAATTTEYEAFVSAALPAWQEQEPLLKLVTKRLHDGWTEEQPLQREKGYFG